MSLKSYVTFNHCQINILCVLAFGVNKNACSISNFKTSTQIPSQNPPVKSRVQNSFLHSSFDSLSAGARLIFKCKY